MRIEKYLHVNPFYVIEKSYSAMRKQIADKLLKEDVNHHQALILIAISLEKRSIVQPRNLSLSFELSKANISQQLRILEQKKFLRRKISSEDARSIEISLTDLGQKKAAKLISLFDGLQKSWELKFGEKKLNKILIDIGQLENGIKEIHAPS